ncbi:hypothetical protein I352_03112 [Cryptococcus deuterogattii MMRL2647]|nr:hypothetical protein I352_03112 [Cryptococcus deuterogattii MMRL2647]
MPQTAGKRSYERDLYPDVRLCEQMEIEVEEIFRHERVMSGIYEDYPETSSSGGALLHRELERFTCACGYPPKKIQFSTYDGSTEQVPMGHPIYANFFGATGNRTLGLGA